MNLFQVKSFINYIWTARYKKGYGLHSPFVFNLVREIIYCKYPYYAFDRIKTLRNRFSNSLKEIEVIDYGAGSHTLGVKSRRVSDLVKKSSIRIKYGELLFRIVNHLNPKSILELGTSIGISTSYLALCDTRREVVTIEGCPETAKVASEAFKSIGINNIHQITGQFRDVLPNFVAQQNKLDLVFFDGHHQKQATLDYFNICLSKVGNETVFVFDDIHWSKGMEEAWQVIFSHPQVTVSLDLFQFGIVFFKKECQKQHFVVRY